MAETDNKPTKGDATRKAIRQAIARIEKGRAKIIAKGRKISIAAVAEEAAISRASIHNNYPDLAERIREINNKGARKLRDEKHKLMEAEKAKNRKLRAELGELRFKLDKLVSINAALTIENQELRAVLDSKNVTMFRRNN